MTAENNVKNKGRQKLKVLGICTSQRGKESNTYFLMKKAFDALNDADVEKNIIVASELKLRPCAHHYSIHAKMCVHPCHITQNDSTDEMKKYMMESWRLTWLFSLRLSIGAIIPS